MTPILVRELNLKGGFEKYDIQEIVGTGGWGTVYKAIRKLDNKIVSLKFFGYTEKSPQINAINSEVMLMMSLIGVDGVVQMESLFYDTPTGFVEGKKELFRQSYPVIVMEMLSGGELVHKIQKRVNSKENILESELSRMFRGVIEALDSIHRRNYIHRDLKLQNLLFVSESDDSPIKIIDFGCMIQLPDNKFETIRKELVGSPGFFAPETLTRYEYSYKTDIWQAGCILYTLLCGHPPFYAEEKYIPWILQGRFCESPQWLSLSNEAKQLIRSMLCVEPTNRISVSEILSHVWMTDGTSAHQLGKDYARRVQSLSLREKLRNIFSKDVFRQNLLLTKENSQKLDKEEKESYSTLYENQDFEHDLSKLPPMKKSFSNLSYQNNNSSKITTNNINTLNNLNNLNPISINQCSRSSSGSSTQSENYHHSKRWFDRLDTNGDGILSQKELVEGIIAILSDDDNYLQQQQQQQQQNDLGVGNLIKTKSNSDINKTPSTCPSMTACVEELFSVIDQNSNGLITFDEFTHFFDMTMHCTIMNRDLDDLINQEQEEVDGDGGKGGGECIIRRDNQLKISYEDDINNDGMNLRKRKSSSFYRDEIENI